MADNVKLNVLLEGAEEAKTLLNDIDAVVNRLNGRNIKIKVSSSGMTRAATQAEKLNTNLGNAANAAQQFGTSGAKAVSTTAAATDKAATSAKKFNMGIGSMAGNLLKFQAVNFAINGTIKAFKSAFDEMKNVDTELVNIRKVTGLSNAEIEKLSKNAYSLATNYGRQASEVLTASTTFARAGYTEQIGQLSELSLLLQNAGDLSADDAAKFLIATDKAYKLGGSYEDLIAVIDGLDNITNKNATDMQKMTDGMTIAGSVFAESGESIQTFAALLGAATANTQRSGSEVARALRTIFMNLRQIRGETEDGELIDGESIAAASKALKDYAGISTMENGQLRKASDVLTELAGKWDTLSETQRAAVSEAVAGKRQANILMALMGDWESVEKMMGEYENSAGTAAKENAAYMDSWAAKTKQVQAAWDEMVAGMIQTDGIKEVLDAGVDLIGQLGSLFKGDSFQGVFSIVADSLGVLGDVLNSPLIKGIIDFSNGITEISLDGIGTAIEWINDLLDDAATKAGKFKDEADEASSNAADILENYNKDFGENSRYQELLNNVNNLTEAERVELGVLELQREEREKEVQDAEKAADKAAERAKKAKETADRERILKAQTALSPLDDAYAGIMGHGALLDNGSVENYINNVSEALRVSQDYYQQLVQSRDAGSQLLGEEQQFVDAYEYALRTFTEGGTAAEVVAKNVAAAAYASGKSWEESAALGNQAAEDFQAYMQEMGYEVPPIDIIANTDQALQAVGEVKAEAEAGANMPITATVAFGGFGSIFSGRKRASGVRHDAGGPALVNENGPEAIAANGLAWIAGGGEPTITMLPRGATVLNASKTRNALRGSTTLSASGGLIPIDDGGGGGVPWGERFREVPVNPYNPPGSGNTEIPDRPSFPSPVDWLNPADGLLPEGINPAEPSGDRNTETGNPTYYPGNGGNSGPAKPNVKKLQKDLDDLLKNLNLQAELAENEEDYLKAMEIYGQAQEEISKMIEQYREAGYAEDSDEILRLKNLGYDYAAKQLGGYDKLQDRLVDALNGLTEATEDANALAEKQEAVDKAREALANAEKQRTVRIFNPVTGQWEWVANAADVQKAQENLQKAQDSLQKEQLDQTLKAIKNAKPEDLAGLTLTPAVLDYLFNGTPEQQSAFLDALNAATGGADYLGSAEAQTEFNQGNNIGTQWNLNGITLTEDQAKGMTIQDLLNMLQGLKMM